MNLQKCLLPFLPQESQKYKIMEDLDPYQVGDSTRRIYIKFPN